MPNLLRVHLQKRMFIASVLHVTAMVALFQLGSVATMFTLNWIKTALHMALEDGAVKNATSITAAKKIPLFVLLLYPGLRSPLPHVLVLRLLFRM